MSKGRISLSGARRTFQDVCEWIPETRLELAGSARRQEAYVGDLDVLVWGSAMHLTTLPDCQVVEQGDKRTTVIWWSVQINAWKVEREYYGAMMQFATGPGRYNIGLRARAKKMGLKLSQYGVFCGTRRIAGDTEESVYAALDKPYKPPELRGR